MYEDDFLSELLKDIDLDDVDEKLLDIERRNGASGELGGADITELSGPAAHYVPEHRYKYEPEHEIEPEPEYALEPEDEPEPEPEPLIDEEPVKRPRYAAARKTMARVDTDDEDDEDDDAEDEAAAKSDGRLEMYDWVQCIVSALVFGMLFFIFVARFIDVDGSSMYPTLRNTDKLITSNLFYSPKKLDVVVVQTNRFGPNPIVKRVIGTGGDRIRIDFAAGEVYVNGSLQHESYIAEPTRRPIDFPDNTEVTVPDGCLFLMGDNRNESTDSRSDSIGFVDERCIIGKVILIAVPAKGDDGKMEWSRFGVVAHG